MADDQEDLRQNTERRLSAIECDVAVIKSNYATKEDIAKVGVQIANVETHVAQVETQVARMEAKLVLLMLGVLTGIIVAGLGAIASVAKFFV